ncbi:MAG: carboxypeptidase regulatory-like domain-containing protein [Acidobacteria bacterium]|nr:MAG: carboxypeptidase regulatory-like domain-containing protein [Acidobacteriota bacterium]
MNASKNRNALLVVAAAALAWAAPAQPPSPEATLRVVVRDARTGQPTPCTIRIEDSTGRHLTENRSLGKGLRSDGTLQRELPGGQMRIRVVRGFETEAAERVVILEPGKETRLEIDLKRVVDLRARGWHSGDSHVHMIHGERTILVTFDDVALAARAEDLQYLSLCQAWNLPKATPETLEQELQKRSTAQCVLTWNLEAPKNYYKGDAGRCLGHCWNLALENGNRGGEDLIQLLMDASAWDYESDKPSYANFESHRLIHDNRGKVFYTHPLRWWTGPWGGRGGYQHQEKMRVSNMAVELPLDVLVGPTFDGMDVITGTGELEADEGSFKLWSMLLNHGYRLAATGSSDSCFDRPGGATPGATRTYTYLPEGFSLPAVARATAAGRTFVTTGPIVLASLDGQPPGAEIRADGETVNLEVEAWASGEAAGDLEKLELIRNGIVAKEIPVTGRYHRVRMPVRESSDAWYSVRAYGRGDKRQRAITGAFYFRAPGSRPPAPVPVNAKIRVVDASSGQVVSALAEEVYQRGPIVLKGASSHPVDGEATLTVPGTARIRVTAPGYQPLILSPFLDNPELVKAVTTLAAEDLLDWRTFERIRELLSKVELEFRLARK